MTNYFYDTSSRALSTVIDDNLIAKTLSFPRYFKGEVHRDGDGNSHLSPWWFITGAAMPNNNGIVRADFAHTDVAQKVARALRPFRERKLAAAWWVGPTSRPANLGHYLQRQGLTHDRDMIGMAADLDILTLPSPAPAAHATAPLALEVEPVTDQAMLENWYQVVLQCFPITYSQVYLDALAAISLRPNARWRHYVGRAAGKVVAASSLYLGAGVAGLYNLGTQPAARGRGAGAQMTFKTFAIARKMGYRIGTLQTTYPNALRLYHRMGFEVYCKIGIYRYRGSR